MVMNKEPSEKITAKILCKLFHDNKKLKFTNKMLIAAREKIRPEIIE